MMKSNIDEHNLVKFLRPTFYPTSTLDKFYPAIICFRNRRKRPLPDMCFVLARIQSLLREKEDATIVAQYDYQKALAEIELSKKSASKKVSLISNYLKTNGYFLVKDFQQLFDIYYIMRDELTTMTDIPYDIAK